MRFKYRFEDQHCNRSLR